MSKNLDNEEINSNVNSVDYGFYLHEKYNNLYVLENGSEVVNIQYNQGDVLKIQRTGVTISYFVNDALLYVSEDTHIDNLYLDMGIQSQFGTLESVSIVGEYDSGFTYSVNTADPSITINTISSDDVVTTLEDNFDLYISGTTQNVANGKSVTLSIGSHSYATKVIDGTWGVLVSANDVANLNLGSNVITASVTNAAGVDASDQSTIEHKSVVSVSMTEDSFISGSSGIVTLVFDKAVAVDSFTIDDITARNGVLSNLQTIDGGTTWTAVFTPNSAISADENNVSVSSRFVYQDGSSPNVDEHDVVFDSFYSTAHIKGNSLYSFNSATSFDYVVGVSNEYIQGDGYVSFVTDGSYRPYNTYFGLDSKENYHDLLPELKDESIDYSFYFKQGQYGIHEFGVTKVTPNTMYAEGDVFEVKKESGLIYYLHNGEVVYTSEVISADNKLYAKSVFHGGDQIVTDVKIKNDAVGVSENYKVSTHPVIVDASVSGNEITLTFDVNINSLVKPNLSAFDVKVVDMGEREVTNIIVFNNKAVLTIGGDAIDADELIELNYQKQGSYGFEDVSGGVLDEFVNLVFGSDSNQEKNFADAIERTVYGGDAAETITTTSASEIIDGGLGDDTIISGSGDDVISGGQGSDTFVYKKDDTGFDTIKDFDILAGGDVLDLSDLLSYETGDDLNDYIQLVDDGVDTLISIDVTGAGNDEFDFANGSDFEATQYILLEGVVVDNITDINNLIVL